MNIKEGMNQAEYFLHIKRRDKVIYWGWIALLFPIDCILRNLCYERFYYLQGFSTCLWLCITCMFCFLVCHQLMLFQNREIDTLKMMGMHNLAIFMVNVYETRYIYILIMSLFAILNVFLVMVPVISLLIVEYIVYWYIYIFLYFVKTWHYHRIKFGKFFYWIKRVLLYINFLALAAFIFFHSQVQALLNTQKHLEQFIHNFNEVAEWANQVVGVVIILSYIVGSEIFFVVYIKNHAIFADEDPEMNTHSKGARLWDKLLKFRGSRAKQLIKMNYILYTRNWNCFISKTIIGGIWIVVAFFTRNQYLCLCVGMLVIETVSALVFYRIRDDINNLKLYEALGYTVRWMFMNHCICAFSYLYTCTFIGIVVGLVAGSLSISYVLVMICWMVYQTIFFTSFNFYFLHVKGINADSQLYEPFACFAAIAIAGTPISAIFPVLLLVKLKKMKLE